MNGSRSIEKGIRTRKQLVKYLNDRCVDGEKELEKGIKVEMEHTKSQKRAMRIAMDHLVEFPEYYIHLEKMERKLSRGQKIP